MPRVAAALAVAVGALIAVGGAAVAAPPDQVPPPSTIPAPTLAPATTAAATAVVGRAGTAEVDVEVIKSDQENWSPRRIATTVGIGVVALAVIGYAYGKIRSSTRRSTSSALVPTAD